MTEFVAVTVIVLMGAAGILSIFQGSRTDDAVVSQPEDGAQRHAA